MERAVIITLYALHVALHVEVGLHLLAQTLGDIAVKDRETLLEELDDGHLAAETAEA